MQVVVFPKMNLAPALPTVRIEQGLLELGFSVCDIPSLFNHTKFPAIPFTSNQLCYFLEYARDVLNHPSSTKDLATLFETNEHIVRRNLPSGLQEPGLLGGHNAVDTLDTLDPLDTLNALDT
jgi:hypothetical protein